MEEITNAEFTIKMPDQYKVQKFFFSLQYCLFDQFLRD